MNVVGKVGSLISQGVYSVATPFHPFGGAVDIIVVQQQDGSFRSTPWYVQFGKFQGVLKRSEKVVHIKVNGVEASFNMNLDNSGEAYFVREADLSDSVDQNHVLKDEREPILEHSLSVDNSQCNINKENVENFTLQSTFSDPGILREEYSSFNHLERTDSDVCRFCDFQDDQSFDDSVKLSPEYGSSRYDTMEAVESFVEAQVSDSEMVLVSVDGHVLTAPISSSEQKNEIVQLDTPQFHLGAGKGNGFCEQEREFSANETSWDSKFLNNLEASSNKPDSGFASRNNNANSNVGPANVVMIEGHGCQDQGSDGSGHDAGFVLSHKLPLSNGNGEPVQGIINAVVSCEDIRGSDYGGEGVGDNSELEVGGDVEHMYEDGGVEDMQLPGGLDEDEKHACLDGGDERVKHQERDLYVPSDVEDTSPSTKDDDKFRSCLDLTSAVVEYASESEVSTLGLQEEAEYIEENHPPNNQSFNNANIQHTIERSVDGGSVIGHNSIDVVEAETRDDSPPSALVLSEVSESERRNHNVIETNDWKDEPTGLSPSIENDVWSAKENVLEAISNRSEGPTQHTRSSSKQKQDVNPSLEISLCRHLLRPGMGLAAADEAFNAHRLSEEEFRNTMSSTTKNENLVIRYHKKYLPWDKAAPIVLGIAAFGSSLPVEPRDAIAVEEEQTSNLGVHDSGSTSGRRWRLWSIPFRRVKTFQRSTSNTSEVFVDSESVSQSSSVDLSPLTDSGTPLSATSVKSGFKKIVRTNIPTNEQISALNLKEGQNDVTFSFSTRVLGLQQVEAHIYLWKWNARIVISDVDGTITRSDVLGQFMPLVGKDWSQSGVARLFSAIKENGYQLLFLSARAIVQAYLTKSFLFNLKQDGTSLPNGPVVISPNGLFPSLFREVIRRAPHEFKIACLGDIKALFPADYNPFYAGFGNRDTDELTYRKMGIPKGKIFIINPKGEVAINHRIDVKSYTSLHTLLNDMFPPTCMVEQEDFNAWNYWKMPLPEIDD